MVASMPPNAPAMPSLDCVLAFNTGNQLAVRRRGSVADLAFTGPGLAPAAGRLESAFARHTPPLERFSASAGGQSYRVHFAQVEGVPADREIEFWTIDRLDAAGQTLSPSLAGLVARLEPHLIDVPYLHLGENDFIYKFRPEKERNTSIYAQDAASRALYQSRLCAAIKTLARRLERTAVAPVTLDFGAVTLHHSEPFRLLPRREERH